jgi:hypothetical protein
LLHGRKGGSTALDETNGQWPTGYLIPYPSIPQIVSRYGHLHQHAKCSVSLNYFPLECAVMSGAFQRSVLGLILFLVYTNISIIFVVSSVCK